jgi:16S rRNA (cytosine1402-N4)-methyltransferase
VVRGNFTQISQILKEKNIEEIDGIVFDLGVSSNQLEQAERGFSFMHNARLDMRMDSRERTDAQELVNELSESELEKILRDYGQEWFSARIARNIVKQREIKRIETTEELVNIVKRSVPRHKWPKRVNVATKTFQAIRIKVNDEIENLRKALEDSVGLMRKNARIVVVSYHSLEDKTVKRFFKEKSSGDEKTIEVLTKKPLEPDEEEVALNNRSRSAKLRAARKL